ncbi:MAG TPA: MFS transporter [Thermoanaerobaculia bacterium]|nr:MFS transporter [Thermoanaerobaculia bacterium]
MPTPAPPQPPPETTGAPVTAGGAAAALAPPARPLGTMASLGAAMRSWRTASVVLLQFSSGMPLGLVWIAIPDWMRKIGVDIRVVGLITLAQAPWTFKFLWSPLMDRYTPPFLGRRRGWAALAQVALCILTLGLAGVGRHPDTPWVVAALALAIAFASATQDIALDAYAVDVLRPDEQAVAGGARTAVYRMAMLVAGGLAITAAGRFSWPLVLCGLALLYLPMLLLTWKAPEPAGLPAAPRTMREAVWLPFVGFLARRRALEILAFVILYRLTDNLAQSLQRPFLVEMGYSDFDRGFALSTIGLAGTLVGVFLGGAATAPLGLGRSLWIFGVLQAFSNLGYVVLSTLGHADRPVMYAAIGFETLAAGLGMGALSVLLLRMTQKRFSATQYALFSSLFGLPRLVAGPICGFAVDAVGWTAFFWFAIVAGLPALLLLTRFAPWGAREPAFAVETVAARELPLPPRALAGRGVAGGLAGAVFAALLAALLAALKAMRAAPGHPAPRPFDLGAPLRALAAPGDAGGWLTLLGIAVFALVCGLLAAAVAAARHGAGRDLAADPGDGA